MKNFLTEVRETLVSDRASRHGPLPPLLVALTFVTGLVDAFSYLDLGHVFVANMTGNVVFLAFALAGAGGFSIPDSLLALVAFGVGALISGRVVTRFSRHRGRLLAAAAAAQAGFLAAAVVFASLSASPPQAAFRYALITVLALAMGTQNAAARKLAVPDLTTTVLTLTVTGIAADSSIAGGKGSKAGRRLIAVATMLLGALAGAALVIHQEIVYPLVIALIIVVVVASTTWVLGGSDPDWTRPDE